jgi:ERF superfamily
MKQSDSIINLASSLATFHVMVGKISKDSTNPFFKSKYAGLPNVLEAIHEPLKEAGLVFTQFPCGDELCTTLIDVASGEFMQAGFKMLPVKNDPQAQGSALTYTRRYSLVAILGLNVDDDDDANKATGLTTGASTPPPADERLWLNKFRADKITLSDEWTKAVDYLSSGGEFAKIEKKYKLSKDNKAELIAIK